MNTRLFGVGRIDSPHGPRPWAAEPHAASPVPTLKAVTEPRAPPHPLPETRTRPSTLSKPDSFLRGASFARTAEPLQ